MEPSFFRSFAGRIRRMMESARSDDARQQLALWAAEFEERAERLEGGSVEQARGKALPREQDL